MHSQFCSVRRVLGVAAVIAVTLLPLLDRADAAIVYGNLGDASEQSLDLGFNFNIGQSGTATNVLAQGFTTGTSPSFLEIQSVILGFGAPANGASPLVQLMAASGANPSGTVLGTFSGPALSNTAQYTYTLPSPITLSPSSTYFIVVADANAGSGGNFNWYFNDGDEAPEGLNGSGYLFASTRKSVNGGTSWTSGGILAPGTAISVVAVPEPPAIVLSGVGLASALYAMRRRRG